MPSSRKKSVNPFGLSGAALKYIAMISMVVDHIGAVVLEQIVYCTGDAGRLTGIMTTDWGYTLYWMNQVCRAVGRIAFPVYCFLLVEGFIHTRDWRKYWLRLAAFALISEIPFGLAVWNTWIGRSHNVYFELAVGILVLQGLKKCEGLRRPGRTAGMVFAIVSGCLAALLLRADYDVDGILMISFIYLLRASRRNQALAGGGLALLESWRWNYGAGALSALPIFLYNGSKGKVRWKYAFYWFYPLHLLALFLIRRFAVGMPLM